MQGLTLRPNQRKAHLLKDKQLIDLKEPICKVPYRVIYADTDAGGIVYYANYLRLFEIGRTEYMREFLEIAYAKLQKTGILMPVIESYCRHKAPGFYDDLLEINTSLVEVSKYSIRFNCQVRRIVDKKILAQGFTIHAPVRIDGKLINLAEIQPDLFRKMLSYVKSDELP